MSKEHYFRIVSNLWESTNLIGEHLTVKDKKHILHGDDHVQLVPAQDEWLIRFDDLHYQDQVSQIVIKYKKEINTYEDLGKFQSYCYKEGHPFELISKIYFVANNGTERKLK